MSFPDLSFEERLWKNGYSLVIGVDEVGRGALAGPVVAGACAVKIIKYQESSIKNNDINNTSYHILDAISSLGINDSKKLSAKKREKLEPEIKKYFYCGIGESGVEFINRFGIKAATERAMRSAVINILNTILHDLNNNKSGSSVSLSSIRELNPYLLIDAFQVKYIPIIGLTHQQAIIKGDEKSTTIAAASIIAKVYRDDLMCQLAKDFPDYRWQENAGYGTGKHTEALKKIGASRLHRLKFIDGILDTQHGTNIK